MKKLNRLLVASALFLSMGLAGCTSKTTTPSSETATETATATATATATSEIVIDMAALGKQALAQIGPTLSKYATTTGATGNFSLTTTTNVVGEDGKSYGFLIVYSVADEYSGSMSISADGTKVLVVNPNTLTGGVDARCKLHAKATYSGTSYAEDDFNILVKAVAQYTIQMLYSAKDGDAVSFKGIVTGTYGADYGSKGTYYTIFVGDGDYGVTVFSAALPDGAEVGSYVSVSGTVSIYSNLYELKSATLTLIDKTDAPLVTEPTAIAISATNMYDITKINTASRPATITEGLVTSVAGSVGANITLTVKVGTTKYTIFENATYNAADDYATFSQTRAGATEATIIGVNDIIDVSGFTSFYTTSQLVAAKITKWTEGVAPKDTPITIADLNNVGWTADTTYTLQGFVTGYYSGIGTPKNGIFIADAENGLDVYNYTGDCSAFTVGTCVTVVGVPTVYNGLIEFTANSITATATADITAKAAVVAEVAGVTGFVNSDTSRPIHATGILQAAVTGTYGTNNVTAKVTVGNGETLNVYLHKSNITKVQYEAWTALAAGDEVEFTGFVANYKSNTTTWAANLMTGPQVVSPTIVKTTAKASIVKATPTMTVAAAVAAAKDTAIDTIGIVQGAYLTNLYQGIFIGDGAASIVTYGGSTRPIIGLVKGVYLHVVGASSPFNGLPELSIANGSITVMPKDTVDAAVAAPTVNTTVSAALAATDLNHQFDITNAVIKTITTAAVAGKTDGKYVVTIGTLDVNLFVKKSALEASVYTALAGAAVGGRLSFTAFGGQNVSGGVTTYQLVAPQALTYTAA